MPTAVAVLGLEQVLVHRFSEAECTQKRAPCNKGVSIAVIAIVALSEPCFLGMFCTWEHLSMG